MEKSNKNELAQFEVIDHPVPSNSNKKGNVFNFILLISLYTMQGLPYGIGSALTFIFQSKKDVTFSDQAYFSMFIWPFSLKLLWAPIVDSLYIQRIGRRKSWLIPLQYSMGFLWFYISINIDRWLPETGKPSIEALTWSFFTLCFLAATQDVVVDGWGLTMLGKNNAAHSSTCNSIGFACGVLIGTICTTLLTSEEFCNEHLRKTHESGGIITIKGFFYFWSITYMVFTTLVGIFKKEEEIESENGYVKISIIQNYKLLWDILNLPCVRKFGVALITMQIGFSAESAFQLKLIDAGISRDDVMMINTLLQVLRLFVPIFVSNYTSGPKPMSTYLNMIPLRLLWSLVCIVLIYYTPILIKTNGVVQVPNYYYIILGIIWGIQDVQYFSMGTIVSGFFTRISDARFGGTYMTMLNTLYNIGKAVPQTFALKMIDVLTYRKCSNDSQINNSTSSLTNMNHIKNDDCIVTVNGYYVEVILLIIIGFVWYFFFKTRLRNLQSKDLSSWLVIHDNTNTEETTKHFKP